MLFESKKEASDIHMPDARNKSVNVYLWPISSFHSGQAAHPSSGFRSKE